MDFAAVKSRVEDNLLDLPTETQAQVGDWVNFAMREAEDGHNFRHMEATLEATTTAATRLLAAKPDTWKEARTDPWLLHDDGETQEIDWAPGESDMRRQYGNSTTLDIGAPQFILETADELHIYPLPDGESDYTGGEYRVRVPYWAYSAELSLDADTNFWTEQYPLYLIHRASMYGFLHNRDRPRAEEQAAIAQGILDKVKRVSKRARLPQRMSLSFSTGVHGAGVRPRRR